MDSLNKMSEDDSQNIEKLILLQKSLAIMVKQKEKIISEKEAELKKKNEMIVIIKMYVLI